MLPQQRADGALLTIPESDFQKGDIRGFRTPQPLTISSGWVIRPLTALAAATAGLAR